MARDEYWLADLVSGGLLFVIVAASLSAQPPPPLPPPPANRLTALREAVHDLRPANPTAERAVEYARFYLESAAEAERRKDRFAADRLAGTVDCLIRVARRQDRQNKIPAVRPGPPEPPAQPLDRIYFRMQQADFFARQADDGPAYALAKWARDFYQLAVRLRDGRDARRWEEPARSASDLVTALENLAQARTGLGAPPAPMPKPPKGVPAPPPPAKKRPRP